MDEKHFLKVSARRVPHHGVDFPGQLIPAELTGSEPRVVLCDRAQVASLVRHALYDIGEYSNVEVLLRRCIKVI